MKRKRVLVLTSSFPRSKKDWWAQFIANLHRNISGSYETLILGPDAPGSRKQEMFGNVYVHRFSYWYPRKLQVLTTGSGILHSSKTNILARMQIPFFIFSAGVHAFIYTAGYKPDIFHAHWTVPQGIIGVLIKKIFGIPLVVTVHGSDIFGLKRFGFLKRFVLKNCDHCTVNSSYTKKAVLQLFPAVNISVIPMGADTQRFSHRRKRIGIKKKLNKKGGPIILCVGRLIGVKGFTYAIQALPHIISKHSDVTLVIVGNGPKKQELANLARKLGVYSQVLFIASIGHDKLSSIYASSDVCVVPSITDPETGETESQGVVVLEAMASGVPVVASKNGGIPDAIVHGENGLLVPSGDIAALAKQVNKIISDKKLAKKIATGGLQKIRSTYEWEKIGKAFERVYDVLT